MHRPQWLLPDWQNAWGFGLRVRRIDGIVRVGHGGAVPGHTSYIEFAPALKFGVIVLTNSNDGDPVSYVDYAMQLLAPVVAKSITHEPKKVGEDLKLYEGTYQSKDYRVWLVTVLNGQLSMVAPDASNPYTARTILEATNERHVFTMRSEGYATGPFGENLTFDVTSDGTVTGFHTENWRCLAHRRVALVLRAHSSGLPTAPPALGGACETRWNWRSVIVSDPRGRRFD
jgi:D-alanyl-D-alanine carboxypeptidase